ncbi:hypothetical protein SAMN05216276_103782 [Streptosporangium subroseum]|uniref:Uncharacterized protein n=1 Tax=Streptosporangium subroseum TaxID=106412 RepID=A0A239M4P8_9ACTN|nr:hypothetical protein [Streptosporangium subroseum]SNT37530.1 hypothetical protein SAMN05216276_103782 [Streptosporangium subroseum]
MYGTAFDQAARQVYLAHRDGEARVGPLVELAFAVYEGGGRGRATRELLERPSAELTSADLVRLGGSLLAEAGFEPGFDLEPTWWTTLEQALAVVERDVRTAGVTGDLRLVIPDWDTEFGQAWVEFRGGCHGQGIRPSFGSRFEGALEIVADAVQEVVMETIWTAWPVCPEHRLGMHVDCARGHAIWVCRASRSHTVALVGELPAR